MVHVNKTKEIECMTGIPSVRIKDDISIVICGEAGQGIQSMEYVLTHVLKRAGYHVFGTKEYMSRIRGGSNSTEIRISSKRVAAFVNRIDLLLPLDNDAIPHLKHRITNSTTIIGEREKLNTSYDVIDVPFSQIAREVGRAIYANTVAVGVVLGLLKVEPEVLDGYLKEYFTDKSQDIVDDNIKAGRKGFEIGECLSGSGKIDIQLQRHPEVKEELLINGADAISLGAIAGGCNFISAYPMSPSTGVFTFLAQHARDFDLIAEQAEDEISAINMAIGAWYAGGRALVSTAGGGYALMTEGFSLAGMLESPLVFHLAQRPAPATGLPTRTEQGDLLFALYGGHGEFPRAIFAPGTIEEAFSLTQQAFNLADRSQCQIFVLTDQYLIDSFYNVPDFDRSGIGIEKHFIKTDADYRRYRITESGVSPRGIPGHGEGLVVLDSDEHDEEGHITEDMEVRTQMVDKRLRKQELLRQAAIPPKLVGDRDYRTLVVAWGSNYHVVKEALETIDKEGVAFLHFSQVHPLHVDAKKHLQKAAQTIVLENNATGQFATLLKTQTGIEADEKILKYNGMPFHVEELVDRFNSLIN